MPGRSSCGRPGPRRSAHLAGDEIPVDEVVKEHLHEVFAAVLVIEIIGVFPDVTGKKGCLIVGQRSVGIRGLDDFQRVPFLNEPGPSAAELCQRGLGKGFFE